MIKKIFISISLILLSIPIINAQVQLSDNAKISIMTTSPWSGASYAVYGHTAIYVLDEASGIEAVFNYGFFDSSQPFFILNFIQGKTDYVLGVQTLDQFIEDYKVKGVEVVEQQLNLTRAEKQKIWETLYINHLPENRKYRYDFLYDNCVTRPRDLIENYVDGKIVYPTDKKEQTYRDLIHECVNSYPWMKFGIDLIIGNEADEIITLRQKMFLPIYFKNALAETYILREDSLKTDIINDYQVIIHKTAEDKSISEWSIISPTPIAFVLILITILVSLMQIKTAKDKKFHIVYDAILFGIIGVGGIIILFMMLFSEHPATSYNWNFMWMNIFALIIPLSLWLKPIKKVANIYHFINFATLTLFLLLWWIIPQQLPIASIPFSISLWIRSGANIKVIQKNKQINK